MSILVSQILTDVRRELLETVGTFWSDAELLRHYNKGEKDFVNKTRVLEDTAQLTLVAGQAAYPLPQNWMSAKPIFLKIINDDGTIRWQRVWPTSLEKVAQEYPNFLDTDTTTSQGRPTHYWIWGRELRLNRAPSATYATVLYMFYKSKPIPITNASAQYMNVPDEFEDYISSYVLWKAWKKEKQKDLADEAYLQYVNGIAEGRRWAKKQAGDLRNQMDIQSGSGFTNESMGSGQFPFTA